MAMPPARFVHKVYLEQPNRVIAVVSDDSTPQDHRDVALSDLTLREMIRAAMNVGITCDSNGHTRWNTWNKDELITAVTEVVMSDGFEPRFIPRKREDRPIIPPASTTPNLNALVDPPFSVNVDIDVDDDTPNAPLITPAPTPTASDPAVAQALVALTAALTPAAPTIDEATVRAMVDRAMTDSIGDLITSAVQHLAPQVTRVEIPNRPIIEIEGRQHAQFGKVLKLIGMRKNVYLVGPAGTGKSTLVEHAARALDLPFGSISLGPTTPESHLKGFIDANGVYRTTAFREAYEHGHVFLLDEMDNGNGGILATLNKALSNGSFAFPDAEVKRHPDFVCVAAANTYGTGATREYVGRNILDAATLDRFVTVEIGIDETLEWELICAHWSDTVAAANWHRDIKQYRKNAETNGIKVMISPRAAIDGAHMLAEGFTMSEVLEMRVFRGVSDDIRRKLSAGVS